MNSPESLHNVKPPITQLTMQLLALFTLAHLGAILALHGSQYLRQSVMPEDKDQCITQAILPPPHGDENGYEAWLRYRPMGNDYHKQNYQRLLSSINGKAPQTAIEELSYAIEVIFGKAPTRNSSSDEGIQLVTVENPFLGQEGFRLKSLPAGIRIEAQTEAGLRYGAFALIELLQENKPLTALDWTSKPDYAIRMLNHWDDPKFDHTLGPYNITRGMGGNSIFYWEDLTRENPRIRDYARLMTSIGINATCINNVNADPDLLETTYLPSLKSVADQLRPYGIRLYISIVFTAPMVTDGTIGTEQYGEGYPFCMRNRKIRLNTLETADPADPRVQQWWKDKADEIYALIPDFGGFLIKANSEGMPGPQNYDRTHAEGANCIARALKPHGGTLIYRTFNYHGGLKIPSYEDRRHDHAAQPYLEFAPLDGKFDDNVIIQTKNGPSDFRSSEPPSPLFGAMKQTRHGIEIMAAQEYLGYDKHIVYQAPHWSEILNFDTHHSDEGSTIASITSGTHQDYPGGAFAIVPNIGDSPNWFGSLFAGANMYAAGKLAWNPQADPEAIAQSWAERTFSPDGEVSLIVTRMLMQSYDLYATYGSPLGLGYLHEGAHHFEPSVKRLSKNALNEQGIGYDRTMKSGTAYISQYHPVNQKIFENPETTPVEMLLFFHHLPWDHKMPDGRTLQSYLIDERSEAVEELKVWMKAWRGVRDEVDPLRWAHVYDRLYAQYIHAGKWRDTLMPLLKNPSPSRENLQ